MEYFILFLEGMITFISPCLLPMIPIYVSFFAGQKEQNKKEAALINSIGFVLGFALVFIALGAFAGTLGKMMVRYTKEVNLILGLIMVLFGLNFMDVVRIPFLNQNRAHAWHTKNINFFSAALFGIIFSIGWTPCVGTFLGSALMMAASSGESGKGIVLLLCYSLGLGIPFIASAVLIDRLKGSFDFVKRHYRAVQLFSGGFLIIMGILMATGFLGYFLSLLTW